MPKKESIYIWCSDCSDYRGEGILALNFIKLLKKKYFEVIFINNYQDKAIFLNHSLLYNYISPFIGIFKLWICHFKKKKIAFINFLPLWNFFIFFLLPRKTVLGPITGALYQEPITNISSFLRKKVLPIFFQISLNIIINKYDKLIFATENLKPILSNNIKKISIFNFQFYNMKVFKNSNLKKKRDIDLLFYNRNHMNKYNNDIKFFLNFFKKKINIVVVGDKIEESGFENLGIIKRNILLNYLSRTKFILSSNENFYSFFSLDAISKGVKIITFKNKPTYFKSHFIKIYKKSFDNKYSNIFRSYQKKNNDLKNNDYLFLKKIKNNFEITFNNKFR